VYEAAPCVACTAFRKLGDARGIAWGLLGLGDVAREQGAFAQAAACYDESLALFRDKGDRSGVAMVQSNVGNMALDQGNSELAAKWYAACRHYSEVQND